MTPSAQHRRDAALRALDPLPGSSAEAADRQVQQDAAWLLALAAAHPHTTGSASSGAPTAGRRRVRRGAVALGIALTGLAGGGVALATTGVWDQVATSWDDMVGHDPQRAAAAPQQLARGTGTDVGPTGTTDLQLFAAPTADGGRCEAVRAAGFSFDSCHDAEDAFPTTALTGLDGQAFYRVSYTSRADYVWGHVDPRQIRTLRVSATDRETATTTVDRSTGYWVTCVVDTDAAHPLTLTAIDADGRPLLTETIAR